MKREKKSAMMLLIATFYLNCHVSIVNQFNLYGLLMRQEAMVFLCHNTFT